MPHYLLLNGIKGYICTHHLGTDDVDPQWKQVLREFKVDVVYALSPQAKGKVERPFRQKICH
jgi:hypothetical protein